MSRDNKNTRQEREQMADPEVTIIGAGALGASVAFHLTNGGARVRIVDRDGIGTQTTARAAGQAMHVHSSDALSRIGIRSIEMFHRFADEVERPLDFIVSGSLKVARTEDCFSQLDDEVARGKALGVDIDCIDPGDAEKLAPWFRPPDGCRIWYCPGDLYFEFPDTLPKMYVSAAVDRGASYVRSEALAIETTPHGVAVRTPAGRIGGDVVVIAAGAWTRQVVSVKTFAVPLWPVRHQVLITGRVEGVHRNQPSVRLIEAKTYTRPHLGGLMFGGYERVPWSPRTMEEVAGGVNDVAPAEDVLRRLTTQIAAEIPGLQDAPLAEVRAGLPTMTPDGHFVIDRVPGHDRVFIVSGCNVAGFSTSPALGHDVAQWILAGRRPEDLAGFGVDRFTAPYDRDDVIRASATAMYADKYSYDELLEHRT
jgi:glycine/D-amino acid oxidase-like deaminating enzyme